MSERSLSLQTLEKLQSDTKHSNALIQRCGATFTRPPSQQRSARQRSQVRMESVTGLTSGLADGLASLGFTLTLIISVKTPSQQLSIKIVVVVVVVP